MTATIRNRLLSTLLVLFGVSLIVFLLLQLVPGDPAVTILGSGATAEAVAALRSELGLDRALPIQFFDYLGGLVRGDLGRSLTVNAPVTDIMLPRFANTIILTGAALLLCIVVAVPLGVIAAHKQYSIFDRVSMIVSLAGASVPVYWFGLLLIGAFAVTLGWLPTSGMYNPRFPGGLTDLLAHLVLPAIAAALVPLAVIARMTRSVMIDILQQDYIRTLRASGLSTNSVLWRHALRNALPPIVNIIGLQVGYLLGGVVFVEVVFGWPGLGQQLYTSITQRDIPVVQAGVLFIALAFVIINLLADGAVGLLDPRTRRKVGA
ncbi:ABC transporter permease [Mycolicibacterium goodii]|uniref:ABC transporter permease n=1 Tax=Mycolicibacterium goodii TaxID=134601 RepID=A0ABS6HRS2_MYCGD|nr:ABC transporter permease [Mycolicibacterium goodii]OKH75756.1 glutathione ABC transporter permease [Mycobacterium sp. SWH-M5]MBU8817384.1 ABC transporter permease [Mycolicibacterium goodii]MBU8824240.1 ABC transporter permease [Mycolicibacterium goodii]MBU8837976.1 ABC transporter permease [Mycolicibacterium goodii]PJK20250.1 ABC transporter permease [Mycolicibacterium goodii]